MSRKWRRAKTTLTITATGSRVGSATATIQIEVGAGYFVSVASGASHTLALDVNGDVFAWGTHAEGELGEGNSGFSARTSPVRVLLPVGVDITQIAAGRSHSLALSATGDVYAWGADDRGQLGDGTTTNASSPLKVPLPAGVKISQVAAGGATSYALSDHGDLYAWGANDWGQAGTGASAQNLAPTLVQRGAVPSDATFAKVWASAGTAYALASNDLLYAWGHNASGQVGDGSTTDRRAPVLISAGAMPTTSVRELAAVSTSDHVVALGSDGGLYGWGDNTSGAVATWSANLVKTPVRAEQGQIPGGMTFTAVGAAADSSYAVGTDGRLYGWGRNGSRQLADGSTTNRFAPVLMGSAGLPASVTARVVTGGNSDTVILGSDAAVYGVGGNASGQLGNGSMSDATSWVTPNRVPASLLPPFQTLSGDPGASVTSAPLQAVGLYGAVSFTSSGLPAGFSADSRTGAVSGSLTRALNGASMTITAQGTAAGAGAYPASATVQLRVNTVDYGYFGAVAAGRWHSVAADVNGDVFTWGYNGRGQLGDGTTTDRHAPVSVMLPPGTRITQVAAGSNFTLALADSGVVYAWGEFSPQLGDGSFVDSYAGSSADRTSPSARCTSGWRARESDRRRCPVLLCAH